MTTEPNHQHDGRIDLGDAVTETRGSAMIGLPDSDTRQYFAVGLDRED
ncbi:hypothetical protein ACNI3Q_00435 [Sphingomonas sp. FW199]